MPAFGEIDRGKRIQTAGKEPATGLDQITGAICLDRPDLLLFRIKHLNHLFSGVVGSIEVIRSENRFIAGE